MPAPSAPVWDRDEERAKEKASKPSTALVSATRTAPPYGQRKSWIPRSLEDFGDGGAYPEIHVAQYPLNLGRPEHELNKKSNALAVQLDASGKVKYDVIGKFRYCFIERKIEVKKQLKMASFTKKVLRHI